MGRKSRLIKSHEYSKVNYIQGVFIRIKRENRTHIYAIYMKYTNGGAIKEIY